MNKICLLALSTGLIAAAPAVAQANYASGGSSSFRILPSANLGNPDATPDLSASPVLAQSNPDQYGGPYGSDSDPNCEGSQCIGPHPNSPLQPNATTSPSQNMGPVQVNPNQNGNYGDDSDPNCEGSQCIGPHPNSPPQPNPTTSPSENPGPVQSNPDQYDTYGNDSDPNCEGSQCIGPHPNSPPQPNPTTGSSPRPADDVTVSAALGAGS